MENDKTKEYVPLPPFVEDFLVYMETIQGKSKATIHEYYYDLRMFFRFMKIRRREVPSNTPLCDIPIDDYTVEQLATIELTDLYAFLNYVNSDRESKPATRARKVASLRSFFKYAANKASLIKSNPTEELESPKLTKRLPKYLELDESMDLLNSVDGEFEERDTCILTLFLNCGMRLSELVGINITDIRDNVLTVIGKGNKERTVYLNNACMKAISDYLAVRPEIEERGGVRPLFISKRKQRIKPRTVEWTVKKYILKAGLDPNKYSVHKLRHTAATLMYTYGEVDIRSLQEILGHESVATTEIYTHVNNARLQEAVSKNPLADFSRDITEEHKDSKDSNDSDGSSSDTET